MLGNAKASSFFCRVRLVNEVGPIVRCHGDVFNWWSVCVLWLAFGSAQIQLRTMHVWRNLARAIEPLARGERKAHFVVIIHWPR